MHECNQPDRETGRRLAFSSSQARSKIRPQRKTSDVKKNGGARQWRRRPAQVKGENRGRFCSFQNEKSTGNKVEAVKPNKKNPPPNLLSHLKNRKVGGRPFFSRTKGSRFGVREFCVVVPVRIEIRAQVPALREMTGRPS